MPQSKLIQQDTIVFLQCKTWMKMWNNLWTQIQTLDPPDLKGLSQGPKIDPKGLDLDLNLETKLGSGFGSGWT